MSEVARRRLDANRWIVTRLRREAAALGSGYMIQSELTGDADDWLDESVPEGLPGSTGDAVALERALAHHDRAVRNWQAWAKKTELKRVDESDSSCEWNPRLDEPAKGGDPWHADAEVSVGVRDNLHLCASCAALPRFARRTSRVKTTSVRKGVKR